TFGRTRRSNRRCPVPTSPPAASAPAFRPVSTTSGSPATRLAADITARRTWLRVSTARRDLRVLEAVAARLIGHPVSAGSGDRATLDDANQHQRDGDDQQDVNEPAECV